MVCETLDLESTRMVECPPDKPLLPDLSLSLESVGGPMNSMVEEVVATGESNYFHECLLIQPLFNQFYI